MPEADSWRFASYGTTPLTTGWHFAPALLAQTSRNRYVSGDHYQWLTANLRIIQEINENFEMQYEGSYQYMDLQPQGYNYHNPVKGGFYKLTIAPTLKANDIGEFFKRPELRLFASWMNWNRKLDSYAGDDNLGDSGFKAGGSWNFGVQMETWF